jgi:probable rRNA maturation factor
MILNRQRRVRVRPAVLEEFLDRVRRTVGAPDESVSICLVSDAAMAQMNRQYRGKHGPTDVLSFPANRMERRERKERIQKNQRRLRASSSSSSSSFPSSPSSTSFLGDIAISPETARRNAGRFGRRLEDELRILILHGVLHLLGYDHEADQGEMERLERRLRRKLRIDRP